MIDDLALARISAASYTQPPTFRVGDCYVRIVEVDGTQVISFKGTNPANMLELIADADVVPYTHPDLGTVHNGFFWDVRCVADRIILNVKDGPVVFTGHSKGGSEALLCAALLYSKGIEIAKVSVFGPARTGFDKLAHIIGAIPGASYRHGNDAVTETPPGFRQPRPLTQIGAPSASLVNLTDHAIAGYIAALEKGQPSES